VTFIELPAPPPSLLLALKWRPVVVEKQFVPSRRRQKSSPGSLISLPLGSLASGR